MAGWSDHMRLRDEIVSASGAIEDVQMSLYNAVYGVAGDRVPYADAAYYGDITYPSTSLIELCAQIAVRLGSPPDIHKARAVWRLDQGMGGGKSHGLIGMYHLARNTPTFAATDVGARTMAEARAIAGDGVVKENLNSPRVVVLSCDNMTPGRGDKTIDGPATTLGERWLWRLFDADHGRWDEYRHDLTNKAMLAEAIKSVGHPVLILIDEIMDYVRAATSSAPSTTDDGDLVGKDMAFLRALLDTANDVPNCVVVVVMIASDKDNIVLNTRGEQCRTELEDLLIRNGRTATVTSAKDFAEIIRRRLFEADPDPRATAQIAAQWVAHMGRGKWARDVFDRLSWSKSSDFGDRVARSFPFHPSLIELAESEWSLSTGFQRVRSTIQIFAAAVWAQQQRADTGEWSPSLIGPGDLPLSNRDVREALLNSGLIPDQRAVSSYREIASGEVVADDDQRGTARALDLNRDGHLYSTTNPRAAERAATALFVYSIGQRPQGRQGATEAELRASCFVPDESFSSGDAEVVLQELRDPDGGLAALEEIPGKGGQPPRFFLSTRQTLNMLVRVQRNSVGDEERDQQLADVAWELAKTGPFKDKVRVETPDLETPLRDILEHAGIDDARSNRLIVLDPRRFSLLNGVDAETRAAIRTAFGLGDDKLPVGWASSAVFACVNTQRRGHARKICSEWLAWKRVSEMDAIRADDDLLDKSRAEMREAKKRLDKAVRDAFQHVVYLSEDSNGTRAERTIRFDKDGETALTGEIVWAALADVDKVFGRGEFDARALLHNLRDVDYNRPLNEIRDSFWNTPRLPLLAGGEDDLRSALYSAIRSGDLRLVDAAGEERAAASPQDINLASSQFRIQRKLAAEQVSVPDVTGDTAAAATQILRDVGFTVSTNGSGSTVVSQDPAGGSSVAAGSEIALTLGRENDDGSPDDPATTEYQVSITLSTSLNDPDKAYEIHRLLSLLADKADGHASHVQLTIKMVMSGVDKDEVAEQARRADGQASATEI